MPPTTQKPEYVRTIKAVAEDGTVYAIDVYRGSGRAGPSLILRGPGEATVRPVSKGVYEIWLGRKKLRVTCDDPNAP